MGLGPSLSFSCLIPLLRFRLGTVGIGRKGCRILTAVLYIAQPRSWSIRVAYRRNHSRPLNIHISTLDGRCIIRAGSHAQRVQSRQRQKEEEGVGHLHTTGWCLAWVSAGLVILGASVRGQWRFVGTAHGQLSCARASCCVCPAMCHLNGLWQHCIVGEASRCPTAMVRQPPPHPSMRRQVKPVDQYSLAYLSRFVYCCASYEKAADMMRLHTRGPAA